MADLTVIYGSATIPIAEQPLVNGAINPLFEAKLDDIELGAFQVSIVSGKVQIQYTGLEIVNIILSGTYLDRIITPNNSTNIQSDGSVTFTAPQSMGGNKITSLANGTSSGDAVNFSQLEGKVDKVVGERLINAGEITKLANQSGVNTGDELITTLVTYAELVSLINGSELKPNQYYKITDFQTVHYLVDSLGGKHGINTGVNEPLIVRAISLNELDKVAISELYPKDIIHYDWNANNWLADEGFATTGVIVTGFKGVILFRHDTVNNNQVGNDFRNVRSRRWECNPPTWDGVTTFSAKAFVKYNNWIYASFDEGNLNNTPAIFPLQSNYWVQLLDCNDGRYWNDNPTSTNGILSGVSYKDCLLFEPLTENDSYDLTIKDNKFNGHFRDYEFDGWNTLSILKGNVFYMTYGGTYWQVLNNNFGSNTAFLTIDDWTQGNMFTDGISYSQICYNLSENNCIGFSNVVSKAMGRIIGGGLSNIIAGEIRGLNCAGLVKNMILGDFFFANTFNAESQGLTAKNNVIANDFNYMRGTNKIPSNFRYNRVEYCNNLDFTGATHGVAAYETRIFRNSSGVARLEYVNGSNVTVNVAPNA